MALALTLLNPPLRFHFRPMCPAYIDPCNVLDPKLGQVCHILSAILDFFSQRSLVEHFIRSPTSGAKSRRPTSLMRENSRFCSSERLQSRCISFARPVRSHHSRLATSRSWTSIMHLSVTAKWVDSASESLRQSKKTFGVYWHWSPDRGVFPCEAVSRRWI